MVDGVVPGEKWLQTDGHFVAATVSCRSRIRDSSHARPAPNGGNAVARSSAGAQRRHGLGWNCRHPEISLPKRARGRRFAADPAGPSSPGVDQYNALRAADLLSEHEPVPSLDEATTGLSSPHVESRCTPIPGAEHLDKLSDLRRVRIAMAVSVSCACGSSTLTMTKPVSARHATKNTRPCSCSRRQGRHQEKGSATTTRDSSEPSAICPLASEAR
ncbi:hypothetical protein EJB05_53931, partial [Eragrostis curvula]